MSNTQVGTLHMGRNSWESPISPSMEPHNLDESPEGSHLE